METVLIPVSDKTQPKRSTCKNYIMFLIGKSKKKQFLESRSCFHRPTFPKDLRTPEKCKTEILTMQIQKFEVLFEKKQAKRRFRAKVCNTKLPLQENNLFLTLISSRSDFNKDRNDSSKKPLQISTV